MLNIQAKLIMAGVCSLFLVTGQAFGDGAGRGHDHDRDHAPAHDGGFFSGWHAHFGVGYVSRHVEEGEEEHPNGAYGAHLEFEKEFDAIGEVFFELGFHTGATVNHSEVEWGLGLQREIAEDLSARIAYFWFHESPGHGTTHDLEGILEYEGFDWATFDLGVWQSLNNGGDLWWLGVSRSFTWGNVRITPRVAAYYDAGYVSKEYDGLNNFLYEVEALWPIADNMALIMTANYSNAQKNLTRSEEEAGASAHHEEDGHMEMMTEHHDEGGHMEMMMEHHGASGDDGHGHDYEGPENPAWVGIFLHYAF